MKYTIGNILTVFFFLKVFNNNKICTHTLLVVAKCFVHLIALTEQYWFEITICEKKLTGKNYPTIFYHLKYL